MIVEQTSELLRTLKLHGMHQQFELMQQTPSLKPSSPEEMVALLAEAQSHFETQRKQERLMRAAKLKEPSACIENINYTANRQLDRGVITSLASCNWVDRNQHLIITGPTGVGKTWLACALAHQAIRKGIPAIYKRLPRLLEETEIANGDGSLPALRSKLSRAKILILDDWAVAPISSRGRLDLLELVEDKTGSGSIIITSQLPVDQWHKFIDEPTIADAILDRLVHRAHRIDLQGESMRRMPLEED